MTIFGGLLVLAGTGMLAAVHAGTDAASDHHLDDDHRLRPRASLSMPCLLGVQNAVPWRRRGVATSSVQFFRNIGGAISVAALGALLNARLQAVAGPQSRRQRHPRAQPSAPTSPPTPSTTSPAPSSTASRAPSSPSPS